MCFAISSKKPLLIESGTKLDFKISGLTNPVASRPAGSLVIRTVLRDLKSQEQYSIDEVAFDSDFTPQVGQISILKGIQPSSTYTYEDNVSVSLEVQMD